MQGWDTKKDAALKVTWAAYRTWAKTSRNTARQLRRSQWYILLLAMGGALLATAGSFVPFSAQAGGPMTLLHRGLESLGALSLAFGAYFTRELVSEEAQRKWLRARAMAEAAKSESFLFLLGVSPYDGADAIQQLLEARTSQQKLATGITHEVMSEAELVERLPAGPLSIGDYVKLRVDDQISFYDTASKNYVRSIGVARKITFALGCVSVALSVVALKNAGTQLIPLVATLTVVLASYVASAQYGYLITSYQATSDQIRELKQEWTLSEQPGSAEAIAKFARGCERAMSAENSAWMAKLSEKVPQTARVTLGGAPAKGNA